MADIFISYSQKDREFVQRLVQALGEEGYALWWDHEIRAGEAFDELIEDALKRIRCVVCVWSRHSVDSQWVRAEAAWAKDRNLLVSTRIDDTVDLPLKFYNVHTKDLTGWDGTRQDTVFRDLVADIHKIAGPPGQAAAGIGKHRRQGLQARSDSAAPETGSRLPTDGPAPTAEIAPRERPSSASNGQAVIRAPRRTAVSLAVLGAALIVVLGLGWLLVQGGDPPRVPHRESQPESTATPSLGAAAQAEQPDRPGAIPVPEMITVPSGTFEMGCVSEQQCERNELPVHTVTFREPFDIGKYEVTFAEYDYYVAKTGARRPDDHGWGRGRRPVIDVSWEDAAAYARWLSDQTSAHYRLPTEAEWEYAARAGTTSPFSTGACITTLSANYDGEYGWAGCPETGLRRGKTVTAGDLPSNRYGLHEIHGNVWEWVGDCWHPTYTGAPRNGSAWRAERGGDCELRGVRGGSWDFLLGGLRSAYRFRLDKASRNHNLGFRVVRD